jgi:hypothetical protein
MKIDWIKIGIARGWSRVVFCVTVSLLALFNGSAYAQKTTVKAVSSKDVLQAGDTIRGVVTDSVGPLLMANVVERDAQNRIVAHSTTDVGGNFAFKLVNPGDRIEFSYIGFETYDTLISADYYEVRMRENPATALIVSADKIRETTAYGAFVLDRRPFRVGDNYWAVRVTDMSKMSYTKEEVAKLMDVKPRKIKSYNLRFTEKNIPWVIEVWLK